MLKLEEWITRYDPGVWFASAASKLSMPLDKFTCGKLGNEHHDAIFFQIDNLFAIYRFLPTKRSPANGLCSQTSKLIGQFKATKVSIDLSVKGAHDIAHFFWTWPVFWNLPTSGQIHWKVLVFCLLFSGSKGSTDCCDCCGAGLLK